MNNTIKTTAILLLSILAIPSLRADAPRVVATTEWTAAFCRAAGIEDVSVLAPASLAHPPDYDLKPSDIPRIVEADFLIFAGYEGMMERIRSHVAGSDVRLVQIQTVYEPAVLDESIRRLGRAFGTQDRADEAVERLEELWSEARSDVDRAGLHGAPAAVHVFQAPFARQVGLNVVMEFGPAPAGPQLIAEAARSGAVLVVDNRHNPISRPLREVLPEARGMELINFPGTGGTRTLEDVILHNVRELIDAAGS